MRLSATLRRAYARKWYHPLLFLVSPSLHTLHKYSRLTPPPTLCGMSATRQPPPPRYLPLGTGVRPEMSATPSERL